jgi:hypothetical protein
VKRDGYTVVESAGVGGSCPGCGRPTDVVG